MSLLSPRMERSGSPGSIGRTAKVVPCSCRPGSRPKTGTGARRAVRDPMPCRRGRRLQIAEWIPARTSLGRDDIGGTGSVCSFPGSHMAASFVAPEAAKRLSGVQWPDRQSCALFLSPWIPAQDRDRRPKGCPGANALSPEQAVADSRVDPGSRFAWPGRQDGKSLLDQDQF